MRSLHRIIIIIMPDLLNVLFVSFADQISRGSTNVKSPAMDIRSARLMIPHPSVQHSQPHMSLLSPSAKSIYNLDYLHRVGSQITERYRAQQNDFYNSNNSNNGGRLSYSNDRNNGSRYNNSNNGSKYSNKSSGQGNSNTSVSPPLSITSSGSSSTSSKNGRPSKSYNSNSMQSVNSHRNLPTTPTMQQSHNGYYQSQSIPFFHSASSNGMQQIFSTAMSPSNQSQHSNQSVGLYVQQNSSMAYHPNNNYHSHNRNYSGGANKKNYNFYR